MEIEITSGAMQRLLGIGKGGTNDLARRGIFVRGKGKGTYAVEASVGGYCHHLREMTAGRGGEAGTTARERLGTAQATLAEVKEKQLAGELVEAAEVEAKWTSACRSIRARVLAVADRMRELPARQHVKLVAELRSALGELADGGTQ
jgi:phage terminase Nu1 subunit (DNA packaging protein)